MEDEEKEVKKPVVGLRAYSDSVPKVGLREECKALTKKVENRK